MTEEKAREKWCPESQHSSDKGDESCIASDCMMWRWKYEFTIQAGDMAAKEMQTDLGYCGLAK